MKENSHKTAISRKRPSMPLRLALEKGFIEGRVLDYGCGRGKDVEHLRNLGYYSVTGYDPNWFPKLPKGKFDTILCIYVLNVVYDSVRKRIARDIKNYLKPGGHLVVAVRSFGDIHKAATKGGWQEYKDGYITGSRTFQSIISGFEVNELFGASMSRWKVSPEFVYFLVKRG